MIVSLLFAAQIDESRLVADFVFSVFDSAIPSKRAKETAKNTAKNTAQAESLRRR